MLKIYTQEQIFNLEQSATSAKGNCSSLDLCEQMSNAFCAQFQRDFKGTHRIVIFAGPGANGALALAIGRILSNFNHTIEAVVLNPSGLLSDDCLINQRRLSQNQANVNVREVTTSFNPPIIQPEDIVIDGMCGIEMNMPFEGDLANVARYVNKMAKTILSIDIPSGLMSEDNSNNNMENVIKATYTYTFHGPKLAFMLSDNAPYVGEWKVINIGLGDSQPDKRTKYYVFSSSDMEELPRREKHTCKYDYGRVALIAGSQGMMGAAILAGRACMRSGAGHLTVHIPNGTEHIIHTSLPEAVISRDKHSEYFTMFDNAHIYDAIAIGPGLGRNFDSAAAFEGLLCYYKKPIIIDADAIHLLASNKSLLNKLPEDSILTPHVGEFDALVGTSSNDYERLMKASQLAVDHRVNIILKGAYTAVCSKSGRIIFNTSGNPGMATAGTGDVLTGTLLALLGRGHSPLVASLFGTFINGYAGNLYANDFSEESLIASDIIDYLPKVFKYFKSSDNFYGM